MLKDEQNCSYNDGGDAKPPKIWSDFSFLQYNGLSLNLKLPFIMDNRKLKISMGGYILSMRKVKLGSFTIVPLNNPPTVPV